METIEERVRRVLDLAGACVDRGQAPQALAHLNVVRLEIDDLARTSLWAEYGLIYARSLAVLRDPGVEAAFHNTLNQISELSESDPMLAMLANGYLGGYLLKQRAFKRARKCFSLAERYAQAANRPEHLAKYQMQRFRTGLEEKKDPRLTGFHNLMEAAKDGYTPLQKLQVWFKYCSETGTKEVGLLAARKRGSVEYFRRLLKSVSKEHQDEIPGQSTS